MCKLWERIRNWITFVFGPMKWKCPVCGESRRWGQENMLDMYPVLLEDMDSLPACCIHEFPLWAYGGKL